MTKRFTRFRRVAFCAVLATSFSANGAFASDAVGTIGDALRGEGNALSSALTRRGAVDTGAIDGRFTPEATESANMADLSDADLDTAALLRSTAARAETAINGAVGLGPAGWEEFRAVRATGDAQWRCLSEALYFEARGEGLAGQVAVAEVILNRVDSKRFPNSVCGVVNQGAHRKNACQFSYNCDGKAEHISEKAAWSRAGKIARRMLDGRPRSLTGEATHYHATSVHPRWATRLDRTARIGDHIFYRYPQQVAQK